MNTPNKLTVLRICLIPIFIVAYLTQEIPFNEYIAVAIFIFASLTDFFDGYLARKYNLITNFGKFLDPLADKLLVNSALLCFLVVPNNPVPFWVVLIIIMRDFIISGFRLVASDNGVVIAADFWGKIKTTVQMVMVIVVIINIDNVIMRNIESVLIYASVLLTVVSLIDCLFRNVSVLSDDPLKGATKTKASAIVTKLSNEALTISFAESCTGGMISSSLINIPGASNIIKQSLITYSNESKERLLGVSADTLNKYSDVSTETCKEMTLGVSNWSHSDISLAVTGYAGSNNKKRAKDDGKVFIGINYNGKCTVEEYKFKGSRNDVRSQTVDKAFETILKLFK